MRLRTAIAAAALFAGPASAQDAGWTSDETLQQLAIAAHRACSAPESRPPDITYGLTSHAEWLAGLRHGGNAECRPRPRLALRIARAVAASRAPRAASGHALLARLYERGIGVPRDAAAARRHLRIAWLLFRPGAMEPPFANGEEADAYLALPETIAILRRYVDVAEMSYVRVRLARALLARGAPNAASEARAVLAPYAATYDAEAIYLLQRATYETGDATERELALERLRWAARWGDEHSRDYLAAIAQRRLASEASLAERREAIALLADAAFPANSPHRTFFLREVTAANGGVAPATLTGEAAAAARRRLRLRISADDYPAAAMRGEEEGAVLLRGLLDPDGWLIYNEPSVGGQPQALVAHVRRLYARRLPPVDRTAYRTTPYVWVSLPIVIFSLSE